MFDDTSRRIVATDLFVGTGAVVTGLLLVPATGWSGPAWLPLVAFAGMASLSAAADRSRAGMWALVAVSGTVMLAIVVGMATDSLPPGALPPLLVGLGAGVAVNRVAFGVVAAIPAPRLARDRPS